MNQEVTESIEQNEAGSVKMTAGQRLREAREAHGLSRDDVAAELRLHVKLISALEDDDRSALPPTAFVSGYLRAYAKLFDLPAEELIKAYGGEAPSVSTDYRPTDRSGVQIVTSRDPKFRLISVVIFGALVALFLLWWANDRYTFIGPLQHSNSEGVSPTQQESGLVVPPLEQVGTPAQQPNVIPESGSGNTALPIPPQEGASPSTAPATAEPVQPTPPEASPVQTVPATPSKPVQEKAAEPAKPAPVVSEEPLSPSTPQATLLLSFQSDSWTQVKDAQGRTLAYGLLKGGRKLELHGVAPFKVFLGYAQGVQVYINGNAFSVTPYLRGDVARFRVGSAKDNSPLDR